MTDHAAAQPPPDEEVPPSPATDGPMYTPGPGELQLTARAVLAGCLLGGMVAAMNIYFGLQTGWSIGGSLIAAILSFSSFSLAQRLTGGRLAPFTRLETNIAQTSASAAGSMTSAAGLLAPIPAMSMLGHEFGYLELSLWAASVAWLGVFFAVPLRRQMVLVERLRFPTGTATAATILAMYSEGDDAERKSRWLVGFGGLAAAFTLLAFFFPTVSHPPVHTWLPWAILAVPAGYTFTVLISPLMLGAGILIGPRVGTSLLVGAILSWGVLAPLAESRGWVTGATMSYTDGARGWILWPGVAIMVADAMTQLGLSWRSIVNTFRGGEGADGEAVETNPDRIPDSWWIGGLVLASCLTVAVSWWLFQISPWMTLLAIAMSSVLAAIAVRSTGETDINPIGGMGKVTQLVYGGIAPGQIPTNLMTAAITGAGASQAGDMMQDLKTGWLLRASPRQQLVAQLFGIGAGIVVCVPIYVLFDTVYEIGGEKLPAPAAHAWRAMAEVLSVGFEAMPMHAELAVITGLIFGTGVAVARKTLPERIGGWLPSGLAVGIAFIVPAYYAVAMFVGSMILLAWRRYDGPSAEALAFAVASGLVAGEGLMGVVTAILQLMGVQPG